MALSEDEGVAPDSLPFTGLLRPDLFHKAKAITNLGSALVPEPAPSTRDSGCTLFSEPTVEQEVIPSPKLFLDVVQRQWAQPGSLPPSTGTERKLYDVAADLSQVLQKPEIDGLVAALHSAALIPTDAMDCLKTEDRKVELSFRKAHQAAAWVVKAALSTSFFN